MTKEKWREREIGALWNKGNMYSGDITINGEIHKVIMFHNRNATPENKQPTFNIYKSKDFNAGEVKSEKEESTQEKSPDFLK